MKPIFDIWSEGYMATGNSAGAFRLAKNIPGETFEDACRFYFGTDPVFDPERVTYWGCHLYDNEEDARKGFG